MATRLASLPHLHPDGQLPRPPGFRGRLQPHIFWLLEAVEMCLAADQMVFVNSSPSTASSTVYDTSLTEGRGPSSGVASSSLSNFVKTSEALKGAKA